VEKQSLIPANIIEEIRNKTDIIKVVSEYVQLKKRGKNYVGVCPFHSEKEPSFTVSPEKQIFHCFGCNEGGNAFTFLMKIENISFIEAVEELAAKLGISLPKSPSQIAQRSKKERLFQIMALAMQHFQKNLSSEKGSLARDYLQKRKISPATQQIFGLGYALPDWDSLFKYLVSRGVNPEDMATAGLVIPKERKNEYYDRFRNRLIFTIFDQRGRPLAFGGRALGDDEPKYLNSPETYLYHKGETLYGLSFTKENIKKEKTAVLVEGYFDAITPFQAGINNLAASLGTALTSSQAKLLVRYCDTVILAFDADSAGGIAAEKNAEILRLEGLKVKVAQLTGGKDPDEIIMKQGTLAFEKILQEALPYLTFKIKLICQKHNLNEIEARSKALKEIAALLSKTNDEFIQKEYAKQAAGLLKTDTDTVFAEIKRLTQYASSSQSSKRQITEKPHSKLEEAEKNLIAIAVQDKDALARIKEEADFSLPAIKEIAELLFAADFSGQDNIYHFLLENLPKEESKRIISSIMIREHIDDKEKIAMILEDCIKTVKQEALKQKINRLKTELKEAEAAKDTARAGEILSLLKSEIS